MEVADDGRISPSGNLDLSRERSNSDPGRREKNIVMNGGNTVPTRRAPTFLNATEICDSTPVAGANSSPSTPPPVRRSKLAISIGRLFRPWKWRRRKKSQKFITTSQSKKFLIVWYCNLLTDLLKVRVYSAEIARLNILSFFANTPSTSTWIDLCSTWLFSFYWHITVAMKECKWKHRFTFHPFDIYTLTFDCRQRKVISFCRSRQIFLCGTHYHG